MPSKAPRLTCQARNKEFVPSCCQQKAPRAETLYSSSHKVVAPSQRKPKRTTKKKPIEEVVAQEVVARPPVIKKAKKKLPRLTSQARHKEFVPSSCHQKPPQVETLFSSSYKMVAPSQRKPRKPVDIVKVKPPIVDEQVSPAATVEEAPCVLSKVPVVAEETPPSTEPVTTNSVEEHVPSEIQETSPVASITPSAALPHTENSLHHRHHLFHMPKWLKRSSETKGESYKVHHPPQHQNSFGAGAA